MGKKSTDGHLEIVEQVKATESSINDLQEEIKSIKVGINDLCDSIRSLSNQQKQENWFLKNLKSPNFFAVWFSVVSSFLIYFIGKPILQFIIKLLNAILEKIN